MKRQYWMTETTAHNGATIQSEFRFFETCEEAERFVSQRKNAGYLTFAWKL